MKRPDILVVDDTESARLTVEGQLAVCDYAVRFADGAETARAAVAEAIPDLVLLDVMMPGTNGIELCTEWRKDSQFQLVPIVLITALDSREDVARGLAAGATEFLTKPTHAGELRIRIANLLDARRYHLLLARQREAALEEVERLQSQLLRMDRLATLGTFAAGVGHEINNIASVLATYTYLLQEQVEAGEPVERADVEALVKASDHVSEQGKAIMHLGAPASSEGAAGPVDAIATAKTVMQMLRVAGRTKLVKVQIHHEQEAVFMRWHPVKLEQVLINLCSNAADACQEHDSKGRVDIHVEHDTDRGVRIVVEDNGPGMPTEIAERAFEPYFTTKPVGRGTGLGLPVIKRLVEERDGTIAIDTAPGRGTKVVLTFPNQSA